MDIPAGAVAEISGYASIFGEADMNGDIVMRGAFADCLRRKRPQQIKFLHQHASEEPIGVWREIRENARGLFVRGEIVLDLERGRDAFALIEAGALDGLSIGFRAVKSRRSDGGLRRRLLAVDLWEISIVTFPMAPGARILSAKLSQRSVGSASPAAGAGRPARDPADPRFFADAVREAARILVQ